MNEYISTHAAERARLTKPFLDKIFTFQLDPTLRAMFGASKPGINWDEVVRRKQTILLDFRQEQDEEMRRFKMLWTFSYLYEWIKTRGRQDSDPFGVIIDEFAHLTQQLAGGTNPLAKELDEFINVYMRQHTIWFTAAHQELYQIDEQLRNTLLVSGHICSVARQAWMQPDSLPMSCFPGIPGGSSTGAYCLTRFPGG